MGASFITIKIYNKDIRIITYEEFNTYFINISIFLKNKTKSLFSEMNYSCLSQITWLPFELKTWVFKKPTKPHKSSDRELLHTTDNYTTKPTLSYDPRNTYL